MPVIDFSVVAGNAFSVLEGFRQKVNAGAISMESLVTNFTKVNAAGSEYITSMSGVTDSNQKLTVTVKQTAKGVEILGQKLTELPKAAAIARKAMTAALNIREARSAREVLESTFSTAGLSREQIDAQRSRISQITSLIERGRATLVQFQSAVFASTNSTYASALTETEQRILNIIKRIESASQRATNKARESLASQRGTAIATDFGGRAAARLDRRLAPQIQLLDPAAQERVRNQIAQIQGLFNKGLDPAGYLRAFRAVRTGVRDSLTATEEEVRHRLERIRIEVNRGNQGSFLNKIFGGGPGGGQGLLAASGGGSNNRAIAALLLAEGVDKAAAVIRNASQDTAEFEKQISLLRTLSQDTADSFDKWQDSILRVSSAVGKSKEEIASAGYDLLSNQITKSADDTEQALTKTSRFAIATNSTVTDSVNLLSSVINSFGKDVSDTDDILAKLFTTIDLGRVKASDLANTFGRPGVAAKSLGLSFEELGAAMITISQTGLGVEQTNTLITNVLHKLINPTEELQKHFDELGVSTGENYARQLGLVGVLEDLIKTTGGSTAELSKFFNEIRGEQGIVQLTSRINVLKDALSKLQDNKTYGGALKEFEQNTGQRFQEEMTRFTNAFIKFKEIALDALIYVTDGVGGLSNALVGATFLATGLGTVFAGLYGAHIFEKLTGSTVAFANALNLVKLATPPILIGTAVGVGLGALYASHQNSAHAAEILSGKANEIAQGQAQAAAEINARLAKSNIEDLKKAQTEALSYVSKIKVGFQDLAAAEKEAFQTVAQELRNDFELVNQAFKRIINEGEQREQQFINNIAGKRNQIINIKDKAREDAYEAALNRNRVAVGLGQPDREGRLQLGRIGQLTREANRLVETGAPEDVERARRLFDEAQQVAQRRRNETTNVPVFTGRGTRRSRNGGFSNVQILKYADGERIAKQLVEDRLKLEDKIERSQERQLTRQRQQNQIDREALKTIQDKANNVTGLKLFDATGKLNYKTPEAALEARDKAIAAYQKSLKDTIDNSHVTPAARIALKKTLEDTTAETTKQIEDYKKITDAQIATYQAQERSKKLAEETSAQFDQQIAKQKDLKREMDAAAADSSKYMQQALASIGTLQENANRGVLGGAGKLFGALANVDLKTGLVKGVSPEQLANRIPIETQKNLNSAQESLEKGRPAEALAFIDEGYKKLKQLGDESEEIYDKTGKLVTVGEFIKRLRVEISLLMDAEDRFKTAGIVSDNQVVQTQNLTKTLAGFATQYLNSKTIQEQFEQTGVAAFRNINTEAAGLVGNLDSMLKVMNEMTTTAENLVRIRDQISKGVVPSLRVNTLQPEVGPPGPPKGEHLGGFVQHFASGGFLQDFYSGKYASGTDRNPTMLADGESVNNPRATARFAAQIIAMNAGFEPSFATSKRAESSSTSYSFGDIHLHVKSGDSAAKTTRELGAAMKREIRRGSLSL